uniref:Polyhomeotic-like protein 2 isoform X2 n=1 Tax=Geotrypetes seraphini TaxID=260995 RepID=A0A6P8NPW7_GEOSA|nr:polyhomeotic-like protein 2 isoform X2 [Geotrypetes seraphini]
MENEQQILPTSSSSTSSNNSSRQSAPQLSVYSGIPDRQTVQVIQQALHRQPSTAAQYLQQMYAAQQQHLMLQTAALQQQQHLSSAQLQNLAAVQQASLAANRQGASPSNNVSQPSASQQPSINLAASPAAAQLISRAQSVNSATATTSGITQQAVLLGNATSPALTASQAQMYLRAQMLIFTPTATVTTVQPEVSPISTSQPSTSTTQVQNLAIRNQQTSSVQGASSSPLQLPSLAMKPTISNSSSSQLAPGTPHGKAASQATASSAKNDGTDALKKGDHYPIPTSSENKGSNLSRSSVPVTTHSLLTPAYTQLQPHQLIQQHQKQIQHQFVIQQQQHIQPRTQLIQGNAPTQLLQGSTPAQLQPLTQQPQQVQSLIVPPIMPQAQIQIQSHQASPQTQAPTALHQCPLPSLHKPCASQQPAALHASAGLQPVAPVQPGHETLALNGQLSRKFSPAPAVILQIQPSASPAHAPPQDVPQKDLQPTDKKASDSPLSQLQSTLTQSSTAASELEVSQPSRPLLQETVHSKLGSPGMTSGNGNSASTVAGTTPQNGENKLPQAIVKPQILTHVIEGFVIQEGAEPFPVGRSSLLVGSLKKKYQQGLLGEKIPQQDTATTTTTTTTTTTDSEMEEPFLQESKNEGDPPKLKCELCGRVDFEYKFKRSKRFCSMACAKRYNVGCTKRVGLFHPDRSKIQKTDSMHGRRRARKGSLQNLNKDSKKQPLGSLSSMGSVPLSVTSAAMKLNHSQEDSSRCSDNSSYEEPLSPLSVSSSVSHRRQSERDLELPNVHVRDLVGIGHHFLPSDPTQWNVEDVYEFIRSLPGCQEISEEFRAQEIDGQALLLLKEDHLMSTMNIKLGPALKIYARISMLKDS